MKKDILFKDLDSLFNSEEEITTPTQLIESVIDEESTIEALHLTESEKDDIIAEWFYRLPKGYAVQPYSEEELKVLDEVLQSYVSDSLNEEVLKEASMTDITNKNLLTQITEQDKQEKFREFLSYIPGGIPTTQLLNFLNGLNKNDAKEFVEKLYTKDSVDSLSPADYASGVGKKIFDIKPEGMGKGEFFIAWLVPGAKNSGGGESFDVKVNGKKYEVKDYRPNDSSGIRLGTKGKVTRFNFWYEIINTLDYIDAIKKIDPTFAILGAAGDQAGELYKLGSDIRSGEFPGTSKKLLEAFYENMKEDFSSKQSGYTMVTLRGANVPPVSYSIEEIPSIKGDKLNLKLTSDAMSPNENKILVLANKIKYVRNPKAFNEDLQTTVNELVGDLPFIVFRKSQINITRDFKYKTISQGTIYILEKELADKIGTKRSKK
jgi:hypothetical protein